MSLRVLATSPTHSKLFADMAASCVLAKQHHPELEVDILVSAQIIPSWFTPPGPWLRTCGRMSELRPEYDLIVQTNTDPTLIAALDKITCPNRVGITSRQGMQVQGRWAQTLMAQLGATRFAPFAPFDLFKHVLMGKMPPKLVPPRASDGKGKWVLDIDSLPANWRSWGEEVLSQWNFTHPGSVTDEMPQHPDPSGVEAYVGANTALASWLAFHNVPVVLLYPPPFDGVNVLAGPHVWYQPLTAQLTPGQVIALTRPAAAGTADSFRYTDEFLGGLAPVLTIERCDSSETIFDLLHYVVQNYINDLTDVDLPIPEVSSACCLHIKGIQSVFTKLMHLNQFGIRFTQEFLDKVSQGTVVDRDIHELTAKIQEVDALMEKTLAVYPELDLYRLQLKFIKSSAAGENMIEVAKSLILIFHESTQTLQAYSELIEAIVKRHTRQEGLADV